MGGTGHYGCVYKCRHRRTGEVCAVKSVEKSKIERLDFLQREVYLLKKMNHRGIVRMVEYYEDADHLRIVTELYTGGELFDRIREVTTPDGCMSEETAAGLSRRHDGNTDAPMSNPVGTAYYMAPEVLENR